MDTKEFKALALEQMKKHGLLDSFFPWSFSWDRSVRRFGSCRYVGKTLSFSEVLVKQNPPERCLQTVLHEIAHALTPGAYHGPEWVRKARELGHSGERCYSEENTVIPSPTWRAFCPKCQKDAGGYFRRKKLLHRACRTPLEYRKADNQQGVIP